MTNDTHLQNLRDCTIQVRHTTSGALVGAGLVVALDGQIVTCAQVIEAAGVRPHERLGATVEVVFPQGRSDEPRSYRASVVASLPYTGDALVLLRLADAATAPLAPEQVAVCGGAERAAGHAFRSYSAGSAASCAPGYAEGKIIGLAPPPPAQRLRAPLLQLRVSGLTREMLGGAVLDTQHNLVVGLICDIPTPAADEDTSVVAQAVDLRLLADDSFGVALRAEPLPLRANPTPSLDIDAARELAAPSTGIFWQQAGPPPITWVGREHLLRLISADYADPDCRVSALIGLAGEGKSSLARRWLETLRHDGIHKQPAGIFWWSFHDNPYGDSFFEAALSYLGGRMVDANQYPSAAARVRLIGAMLHAGRYLFVLDGLDAMQQQQGNGCGLLEYRDLRNLLRAFAAPGHDSFCLLTSRLHLPDLIDASGYTAHPVGRLAPAEGRALLEQMGVQGTAAELEHLADALEGHALNLQLIGAYLAQRHEGTPRSSEALLPETPLPRHKSIAQTLLRRLRVVNRAERTLLRLLSVFRMPVDETALARVCRPRRSLYERLWRKKPYGLVAPLARLKEPDFYALLKRLLDYGLIQRDTRTHQYRMPPAVHAAFAAAHPLADDDAEQADLRDFHGRLKEDYLIMAGELPRFVTLGDLEPLCEAVAHACCAGAYDDAFAIYWQRIEQGHHRALAHQIGAYATVLELMRGFFAAGDDWSAGPQVSDATTHQMILDTVGFCLISLERVREAAAVYATKNTLLWEAGNWHDASTGCRNLTVLYLTLGDLAAAAQAAAIALDMARHLEDKRHTASALAHQGWVEHLRGNVSGAASLFAQASQQQREAAPEQPNLLGQEGIWYADHLRLRGEEEEARRQTEEHLELAETYRWARTLSQGHRLLGELAAADAESARADHHYTEAVAIARTIAHRPTLIEALLARGRTAAQQGDAPAAQADLAEALTYATAGDYRLYEVELRMALAEAHAAAGDDESAQAEELCSERLIELLDYYAAPQPAHPAPSSES
jgi:hypothetical protein